VTTLAPIFWPIPVHPAVVKDDFSWSGSSYDGTAIGVIAQILGFATFGKWDDEQGFQIEE